MSHAYYSLYCKQRELQQPWEAHWACGFASLVTCLRILGDRTTEDGELVARFRESGGQPHDGMTTEEAISLGRSFGCRAVKNPSSTLRDADAFMRWMQSKWSKGQPTMLVVDSGNQRDEGDHWWTVYGDPGQTNVWVMDPLADDQPFYCLSTSQVMEYASCDDGQGYIEHDGVAISLLPSSEMVGIPPSVELMNFLNEKKHHDTGWTSQPICAALVDNHFSTLEVVDTQGKARGAKSISVAELLEKSGPVADVIDHWGVFFSGGQRGNMEALRAVLYDIEAHMSHKVAPSEADQITREIALNLILIGTNLMDG